MKIINTLPDSKPEVQDCEPIKWVYRWKVEGKMVWDPSRALEELLNKFFNAN